MRLWLKFLLATGAVILISLVVTGLLAGLLIQRGFDQFVVRFSQAAESGYLQQLVPSLAAYYERNGSWAGLEQIWQRQRRGGGMGPSGAMRLLLLDENHRVVLDTTGELTGQAAPAGAWESGTPIFVRDQEVGRVVSAAGLLGSRARSVYERAFLNSLVWVLVVAGIVGALAAGVVAALLVLQITAPARELTTAAQRVAAGDLAHRVEVHSQDELGEVGTAFNEMASALAHQEELRQHMVADIAHELRTPLSVMRVELESLQDGLTEATPQTIASLREEVDLLSRLVEDLRLLSRVDAGQLTLKLGPVSLAGLVQQLVQQASTAAERKGIHLQADVPDTLPPARADPDRLQQVLLNLLSNALRHTPAGGRVRLSARAEGIHLHLQVADSGEGIAPEDLPHVFDRFYRADTSRSRVSGGSGLGLTIARGLVEAMGGRMWAESALGRGTTLHFSLPAY